MLFWWSMQAESLLYEGKVKRIYRLGESELIQEFKNSATAFNGQKKEEIKGKAEVNAKICSIIFDYLNAQGVPTHFLELVSPTKIRSLHLEMIPVEVVVRNRVAGSLAKRLKEEEGAKLLRPVVEWFYKDDEQGDPQISEDLLIAFYQISPDDVSKMKELALEVNRHLTKLFAARELDLVDFKLEFGKDPSGRIVLGDEISPDSCRIWDAKTSEKLDKDRFRYDLGDLMVGYNNILERLEKK